MRSKFLAYSKLNLPTNNRIYNERNGWLLNTTILRTDLMYVMQHTSALTEAHISRYKSADIKLTNVKAL